MNTFSKAAFVTLFTLSAAQDPERDIGCPTEQLNCKELNDECGYKNADDYLAFCGEGLVCQSDMIIPAEQIKSYYMGTCKPACDNGHVEGSYGICTPVCQVADEDIADPQDWLTVLDGEFIEVDTCGNRCRCDAQDDFKFKCADNAPCKKVSPVCEDSSDDWRDSKGKTCAWYEEDALRCSAFGKSREGPNGLLPDQACCVCGGGRIPSLIPGEDMMRQACEFDGAWLSEGYIVPLDVCDSPCECVEKQNGKGYEFECFKEPQCEAPEGCYDLEKLATEDEPKEAWKDLYNRPCAWYAQDPMRCLLHNDVPDLYFGQTASEACCACGGGLIDIPEDDEPVTTTLDGGDSSDSSSGMLLGVVSGVFGVVLLITCGVFYYLLKKAKAQQVPDSRI